MDINKLESITTTEAERILDDIWSATKPDSEKTPDLYDEFNRTMGDGRIYKITACYFLWKMKTDKKIKTAEDLSAAYHSERYNDPMFTANDLCEFHFSYNEEEWKKFRSLIPKYSEEQLAACILKLNHFDKEYYEEAPKSIETLANGILELSGKDKVAEVNAESCSYLLNSQKAYPETTFVGIDENFSLQFSGYMKSEVLGYNTMHFAYSECVNDDITKAFINTVIAPCRTNMERYFPRDAAIYLEDAWNDFPRDIHDEWSLCAVGIAMTHFKGKSVAVMNAGELTVKSGLTHRKYLCDHGFIEGVIALPDKMYSSTWVNTYLVIMSLGNNQIRFLDARDLYVPSRIKGKRINDLTDEMIQAIINDYHNDTVATVVPLKDIERADYNLNPLRYITKNVASSTSVALGSLIRGIKRGITLKASDMDSLISNEESKIKCIRASQISSGIIEEHSYYHGELKKPEKNSASWENVLISKVGSPFKVAIADADYLVIGNIYILDIDREKITPEYIKCFLSSDRGQAEIMRLSSGASSPVLNISEVEKIQIPMYKRKKQAEMEQRSIELVNELESYHHQIKDAENELAAMFD